MEVFWAMRQAQPGEENPALNSNYGNGIGLTFSLLHGLCHLLYQIIDLICLSAEQRPPLAVYQPVFALVVYFKVEDKSPLLPDIGKFSN